jgi:hypothetical protein
LVEFCKRRYTNMSKMAVLVMMLCVALTAPVSGYWEKDDTSWYCDPPDGDMDTENPIPTWWWSAEASGTIRFDTDWLSVSGHAEAEGGVYLTPGDEPGSDGRWIWAYAHTNGESSYHWVEDSSTKYITVYINGSMDADIRYTGDTDYGWETVDAYCRSGSDVLGGGGVSTLGYYNPGGVGIGQADTGGGNSASNSWWGVGCTVNSEGHDSDDAGGYYNGRLGLYGTYNQSFSGTPKADIIYASVTNEGEICALGELEALCWYAWWGYFAADASFSVDGGSTIVLDGVIDDLI